MKEHWHCKICGKVIMEDRAICSDECADKVTIN